ncbi:MAG: family 10 glycosylhydrolase [Chloroflexi bacterium]|nr:family 10 glycosylhydrolase [Chloroflexota bacterium]
MKRTLFLTACFLLTTLAIQPFVHANEEHLVFLPFVSNPENNTPSEPMVEFRGIWVSRFDWTSYGQPANPTKIDEIVNNVAAAGFNVIFFQVRGIADSYYAPGLEPWADRVSGTYGQAPDPLWDPLATMIEKAHAANIQVHAYMNVYPVWNGGSFCDSLPDDTVTPTPLYHQLIAEHGTTDDKPNGFIWDSNEDVYCGAYMRAVPSSIFLDDHLVAVGKDIVNRYNIDGLHLDHIRYGGSNTSCDPVSAARYGADCFSDSGYADWQRQQVNGTVSRFYHEVAPLKEGLWLSAAVWPIHEVNPDWGFPGNPQQGNINYYQDSKAWVAGEYIDSISPMIYPGGSYNCPDDSYWPVERWETLVDDFQAASNGRYIIPGIGTGYCTFDEIEARITKAREIGTAGHALFSYSSLLNNAYFDDLASGPYAETAVVPTITWHP